MVFAEFASVKQVACYVEPQTKNLANIDMSYVIFTIYVT